MNKVEVPIVPARSWTSIETAPCAARPTGARCRGERELMSGLKMRRSPCRERRKISPRIAFAHPLASKVSRPIRMRADIAPSPPFHRSGSPAGSASAPHRC